MMGRVINLPPQEELNSFFSFLWEKTEGFVYCATKETKGNSWLQHFFQWPEARDTLVEFVSKSKATHEVYVGPSLFRERAATKEAWLGSHVLWAEFDYGTPETSLYPEGFVQTPALRIRSSTEQHQHWYWKLDRFCTDPKIFESATRRIAYGLKADLGTWNCNRVLRPPSTIHHESGQRVDALHGRSLERISISTAALFPEPPQQKDIAIDDVPDIMTIISKYKWPTDVFNVFRERNLEKGKRSDRMVWLAYECADMGMLDTEILSVLYNVDGRWKKFHERNDKRDQLVAIIARARLKYPYEGSYTLTAESKLPVMGATSFIKQDLRFEWIIDGILPKEANAVIVAPQATGKTQFTLQTAIHMALGKPFLGWKILRPVKSAFFSLEMSNVNLHYFLNQMMKGMSESELQLLEENLLIVPLGQSLNMSGNIDQAKVIEVMNAYKPEGVLFDSLGRSIKGSSSDEELIGNVFDFYKREVINKYKGFTWSIHHFRKAQVGNKRPNKLDDLRGSGAIGDNADLVLSMWETAPGASIECSFLKTRMSAHLDPFHVKRTENLGFELCDPDEVTIAEFSDDEDTLSDSI